MAINKYREKRIKELRAKWLEQPTLTRAERIKAKLAFLLGFTTILIFALIIFA